MNEQPDDFKLNVPGHSRRWLAEVLWKEARQLEAEARKARRVRAKNLLHRADRLRLLGSKIVP